MKLSCLILILTFLFPVCHGFVFSQKKESFSDKFIRAKNLISSNDAAKALPLFKEMYENDPSNSNLNYLLGVCYTEDPVVTVKSVFHLEKALKDVTKDYDPGAISERHSPVFVHYYLVIAYSQNSRCEEARRANNNFRALYGMDKNDYYVEDAVRWVKKCKQKPGTTDTLPVVVSAKDENIVIKTIDYTTSFPLYGVQVGMYSRLVPVRKFTGLNNLEAFMDKSGMIRYVIGHFIFRSQADALLQKVQEAGYKDAFVVNVNDSDSIPIAKDSPLGRISNATDYFGNHREAKKFSNEVVTYGNRSLNAPTPVNVTYSVQIGAFRDSIPSDLVNLYMKFDGLKETHDNGLTVLTSGSFSVYEKALEMKNEFSKAGITRAFVVAYSEGVRIPVSEAKGESAPGKKEK